MIIEIPLIGGANTVTDLEDVGTGFVEFVNWGDPQTFKGRGKLTQWQGFGTETTVSNLEEMTRCIFWIVPETGNERLIIYDSDAKEVRYMTTVFTLYSTSSTSVLYDEVTAGGGDSDGRIFANINATDIKIYNHGQSVRFANGLSDKPRILLDILPIRDFFWSGESTVAGLLTDYAFPRNIAIENLTTEVGNSGWFTEAGGDYQVSTHNLSSKSYYYKYSYIFDGNQESPLIKENVAGSINDASLTETVPSINITIDTGSSLANFNKRIVGINIYRATAYDGLYYKIVSVSTLTDDPNIMVAETAEPSTSGELGQYLQLNDSSGVVSANHASRIILFNGYSHTLGAVSSASSGIHPVTALGGTSYNGSSMATRDHRLWRDKFTIIQSNLHTVNGGGTFESDTDLSDSGWTSTGVTLDGSLCVVFNPSEADEFSLLGSNCLYLGYGASGTPPLYLYTPVYTVSSSTEYYFEIWVAPDPDTAGIVANSLTIELGVGTSTTASSLTYGTAVGNTITNGNKTSDTYTLGNGKSGWEKISVKITTGGSDSKLAAKFKVNENNRGFLMDSLSVGQLRIEGTEGFGGVDTIMSPELNLGHRDSHKGWLFQTAASIGGLGEDANMRGWVNKNSRKVIQVYRSDIYSTTSTTFPYNATTYGDTLLLNDNYLWRKNGNDQLLNVFDKGLPDGTTHPYGDTKIVVNHKYSTISDGRQFVANVKLDPDDAAEVHKDWIIFSEFNQYDVLPITNYIPLNDKQGGEITGIEKVLGDIVVFMERGVYRLSVPSHNPTEWSLAETYENIGCEAPNSIVSWNGGVFFMAKDNYYFLDSNFNLSPVGDPIRDEIATFTETAHAIIDDVHNRLILNPKATSHSYDGHWVYDLKENHWRQELFGTDKATNDVDAAGYFKDKDGVIRLWDNGGEGEVKIRKVYTAGGGLDMLGSSQGSTLKTGLIRIADSGNTRMIRRLNFRGAEPSENIIFTLYNEGGTSIWTKTVEIPTNGNLSMRVSARAELVQLKVSAGIADFSIERLAIEVD